jgi:hypothetical protein
MKPTILFSIAFAGFSEPWLDAAVNGESAYAEASVIAADWSKIRRHPEAWLRSQQNLLKVLPCWSPFSTFDSAKLNVNPVSTPCMKRGGCKETFCRL